MFNTILFKSKLFFKFSDYTFYLPQEKIDLILIET